MSPSIGTSQSVGTLPCELDCKLTELHRGQATIDEDWVVLRDKIHDTAIQLFGPTARKTRTGLTKMMKKSRKC